MYLFLDTETGGLKSDHPLLSVGLILTTDNNKEIDRLGINCIPSDSFLIDVKALLVNKINLIEHSKIACDYNEASVTILKFLEKHKVLNTNTKLVGHNIHFDLKFINKYLLSNSVLNHYFYKDQIDTKVIASILNYNNKNLAHLAQILDIDISKLKTHTALDDAEITRRCFFKMYDLIHGV